MLAVAVAATLAVPAAVNVSSAETGVPAKVAVIDFDYKDSAGEPRDQTAEHRARMAAFISRLRADLAAGGKFAPVTIACADPPCTAGSIRPPPLSPRPNRPGRVCCFAAECGK